MVAYVPFFLTLSVLLSSLILYCDAERLQYLVAKQNSVKYQLLTAVLFPVYIAVIGGLYVFALQLHYTPAGCVQSLPELIENAFAYNPSALVPGLLVCAIYPSAGAVLKYSVAQSFIKKNENGLGAEWSRSQALGARVVSIVNLFAAAVTICGFLVLNLSDFIAKLGKIL